MARFTKGQSRPEKGLTTDIFVVKCIGRGLVVKRPGVLSKNPDAESCLGGGGLFPSSNKNLLRLFFITNPGTTPITILAVNLDHGLSFAGEETRTMV